MLPKPYYQDDAVTIYHADCRDILSELPKVDLVLTDPPYGVDLTWHRESCNHIETMIGVTDKFDLSGYDKVFMWGFPYINLATGTGWLVWEKHKVQNIDTQMLSPIEMGVTNLWRGFKLYEQLWCGYLMDKSSQEERTEHPTQKPLRIHEWIINKYTNESSLILDPFMGSGTTLRAAKNLGRKAIGIEIEEKYCEIAAKRMAQTVMALA